MAAGSNRDRESHEPELSELTLQRVLDAVVDPVRRSILRQLQDRGEDISCGTFILPVARSTATHHFNVLREAGLSTQYYKGTSHMNTLRRDDLNTAFPGLLDALLQASNAQKESP